MKTTTRSYRMGARGEAVAATRLRILEAGRSLGIDDLNLEPTLEDVAERAGVSVQTVLRHFGSREGVLIAPEAAQEETRGQGMMLPMVAGLAWPGLLRRLDRHLPGYDS